MGKVKAASSEKKVVSKFEKKGKVKLPSFKSKSIKVKPAKVISKTNSKIVENNVSSLPINKTYVNSGVKAALKAIALNQSKTELIDTDVSINLLFSVVKIPKCPSRTIQVKLPCSLATEDSETCFITADLKNEDGKNHDKNINFYEDLFKERGVTRKITIIPYHQLRTEYLEFEMQRRLFNLYDNFFIDGRIRSFVEAKFFYHYYNRHKSPIPIDVNALNLESKIENALMKQEFHLHPNGDTLSLRVGHSKMKADDIVENILSTHQFIETTIPGGFNNIRNLHLVVTFEKKSVFIPIYMTLKNNKDVKKPTVQPKRSKHSAPVTDELTTLEIDDVVRVHSSGKIQIITNENGTNGSNDESAEIEATAETKKTELGDSDQVTDETKPLKKTKKGKSETIQKSLKRQNKENVDNKTSHISTAETEPGKKNNKRLKELKASQETKISAEIKAEPVHTELLEESKPPKRAKRERSESIQKSNAARKEIVAKVDKKASQIAAVEAQPTITTKKNKKHLKGLNIVQDIQVTAETKKCKRKTDRENIEPLEDTKPVKRAKKEKSVSALIVQNSNPTKKQNKKASQTAIIKPDSIAAKNGNKIPKKVSLKTKKIKSEGVSKKIY